MGQLRLPITLPLEHEGKLNIKRMCSVYKPFLFATRILMTLVSLQPSMLNYHTKTLWGITYPSTGNNDPPSSTIASVINDFETDSSLTHYSGFCGLFITQYYDYFILFGNVLAI